MPKQEQDLPDFDLINSLVGKIAERSVDLEKKTKPKRVATVEQHQIDDVFLNARLSEIDDVLETVKRYWKQWPEIRLGQLMSNMASHLDKDLHYIEDRKLKKFLDDEPPRKS